MRSLFAFVVISMVLSFSSMAPGWAQSSPKVKIGQKVPDFTLLDQAGKSVKLSDFKGKVVLVTFLYTQCPDPSKCPMLAEKLGKTRDLVDTLDGGRDRFQIMSITIDPKRDTPEHLKGYSQGMSRDFPNWSFLTGKATDVAKVAALFDLMYWENKGVIDHNMRTAIIDKDGRLSKLLTGNDWKVGELTASIREQLER